MKFLGLLGRLFDYLNIVMVVISAILQFMRRTYGFIGKWKTLSR